QLVGGSYDAEVVRIADPVDAAGRWAAAGFRRLHVVDLDAATGRGGNGAAIERILARGDVEAQVGGGVSSSSRITALLDSGAANVIVGTRAIADPAWLRGAAARRPGQLMVAVDVRSGRVAVDGWTRTVDASPVDQLRELRDLPLAGVLVTAVDVEGRLRGPDLRL